MKVKDMVQIINSKEYYDYECNFKLKTKGPQVPAWFKAFVDDVFKPAINSLNSRIDQVEANLNARIDQVEANLNARLDNIVKLNNLKE